MIRVAVGSREPWMPLLLLGDEQEEMVRRYLDRGVLYVMEEAGESAAVCLVTEEGPGVYEIKSLAVAPGFRRQGRGRAMVEHACAACPGGVMLVGTGETPSTLRFYRSCGFVRSHRVENFFTDHYDHPIVEEGVVLRDMVYLKRTLKREES